MIRLVLIGMKHSGKTTLGRLLASRLDISFFEFDDYLVEAHEQQTGDTLSIRDIFKAYGNDYGRCLETECLRRLAQNIDQQEYVVALGGGTPIRPENHSFVKKLGTVIYLLPDKDIVYNRILKKGVPAFFPYPEDPRRSFEELWQERHPIYSKLADCVVRLIDGPQQQNIELILKEVHTV